MERNAKKYINHGYVHRNGEEVVRISFGEAINILSDMTKDTPQRNQEDLRSDFYTGGRC